MYHGIPTLVASESPVGKFIQSLTTPVRLKPLVYLTDNSKTDKNEWIKKINEAILNPDLRQWAKELCEHLQTNDDLWKLNTSVLNKTPKKIVVNIFCLIVICVCIFS